MTHQETAKKILEYVGGAQNVTALTHCVTRLRFRLKDERKADQKAIEALDGVLGVQRQAGQFQIIVGSQVGKMYQELMKLGVFEQKPSASYKPKKAIFTRILETLSSILIPSLPPIIGGGMIKGFLYMFWEFGWIEMGSDLFNLFNIMSDCMFYFYPFLLAASAAKRFQTNPYMALAMAGVLMHPTIYEGINGGLESFHVFGITIPYLDYNASVLPIILSVWIMSYLYRLFEAHIPDIVSIIFTPMLTLLIMVPITLAGIAPLGYYIGEYLAIGAQALIDFSPVAAGFVIGALRPLTVFTGTHHAVRAIVSQQLATYGYTTIGAMNYMSTMAQAAAPLAIYLIIRKHDSKMRDLSLSSAISGFLGVTEPGLYGVIVKYKVALIAVTIGGGIGAAISSAFGAAEYGMVMSSLVTIPATIGNGFMGIVIGLPVSIFATMLILFLFRHKVLEEDQALTHAEAITPPLAGNHADSPEKQRLLKVKSPISGRIKPLQELSDETFSRELVGKGVAVLPDSHTLITPFDATVTTLLPTKHAIGLTAENGIEMLIHIGIDTVNLDGQYFHTRLKQGDTVHAGQPLIEFDADLIRQAGYATDVIVLITNSDQYLDVFPNTKQTAVSEQDDLLQIIA